MPTNQTEVESPAVVRGDDAYHLTPDGIKEPPKGWGPSLRYFGPGLILSASIVGSGELIATTTLGAQAGFAILWMVIFSTLVKVAVQIELARWTISTGEPALTGYNRVPPRFGRIGWVNVLWIVLGLSKLLQIGGIVGGLTFAIPAGALGAAIAMFGITGVGADEITFYTYWCVEKGYARWAGPPDGSEEWARRANGWVSVMYKGAMLSWFIYTFGTLAFFIMGAAVLNPQGLVPAENEMITTLSRMYTDAIGDWASILFLVGAIAVLGSTLWAAIPSWSRMYTNLLSTLGVLNWNDAPTRLRWIRGFTVALPIIWGAAYLFIQSPVLMVQIGGVVTGIFLLAVVVAVWYLRNTEVDSRLYGGGVFNAVLIISSIAIALLGVYTVLSVTGVFAIE